MVMGQLAAALLQLAPVLVLVAVALGATVVAVALMYLSYAWVVAVLERASGIKALRRSAALVRNNWWRATTVFTVALVLVVILQMSVMLLSMVGGGVSFATGQMSAAATWSYNIGSVVIGTVTMPWLISVMLVLYHDLRLRREGGDLEQRIAVS